MKALRVGLVTVVLVWLARGGLVRAADAWVEVKSEHFRVVSNAGEANGRHIAWQFEQIRTALETAWPFAKGQLDRPVIVIAAKDELTMRQFAPEEYEKANQIHYSSYSWSAADAHYFLLRDAGREPRDVPEGENPYRSTYWSYGNVALGSGLNWRLPYWFQRGLAAVLSNTIISKTDMQTGRPIPFYVEKMREGRFPLDRVLAMTHDSPELRNAADLERFDAQMWGLMQYLLYGQPGQQNAERINRFVGLLLSGASSEDAVTQVYGSLGALDNAYWQHVAQGRFFYSTLKLTMTQSEASYAARPMKPEESAAMRGAWLTSRRRSADARAAITEARKLNPDSPLSYEVEGRLLETENAQADAAAAFARAVALGSTNFYAYVQAGRAMVTAGATSPDDLAKARGHFERAVALNPQCEVAYNYLANVLAQAGQYEAAIAPARQAQALTPGRLVNYVLLARVLARAKHPDEAMGIAKTAEALAKTDADKRLVQSLIAEIQRSGG